MIDMVEARVIAGQIAGEFADKRIVAAELAARKSKSMRDAYLLHVAPEEFRSRLKNTTLTGAYARYRHICMETSGGVGIDIWDIYGKVLAVAAGATAPGNPPIVLRFEDGSSLAVLPGVWGAMRLAPVEELRRLRDTDNPAFLDSASGRFSTSDLKALFMREEFADRSVKEVLTRHAAPAVMSMMGSLGQEALYRGRLHPKRKACTLSDSEVDALRQAILSVTADAIKGGGRASEVDLFGRPGGFRPTVSAETAGTPCPACGALIEQVKLGGAGKFFICPGCQVRK